MKTSPRTYRQKGFTLIELIVVIAILGVLSGIAYPVYITIQKNAARSAAEKVCMDIVEGVTRYAQDNNSMLPYDPEMAQPDDEDQIKLSTLEGQDARLVEILTNRETDDENRLNYSRDTYLRSDEKQDGEKADGLYVTDTGVNLYDPWGMPYHIVLCVEEEGCIDPYTSKRLRGKKCLVYSLGPDKLGAAPDDTPARSSKKDKKGKKDKKDKKGKKAPKSGSSVSDEDFAEQIEDNVYSWKKSS